MTKPGKDQVFPGFPKVRPPLPEAYKKIFEAEYESNREGGTAVYNITKTLEAWMHRKVAKAASGNQRVLEIGAGTLNHVEYEPGMGTYDIIEPHEFLYQGRKELSSLNKTYKSINQIKGSAKYHRIFSIAVLEHVTDLPLLVAKSVVLLKKDGLFQAGIPAEGGFLWGLAWRTTTGVSFRLRHKLKYATLMRHEHINEAKEIVDIIKYFFEEVRVSRFPLPFKHLNFYEYIEAKTPRAAQAADYIKGH